MVGRRILIGAVLLIGALSALCQTPPSRTISVSGDAEVRVVPDEVILNVGVENGDKVLKVAKVANDAAIHRALEVATRHGVASKDVQTDFLSIEPVYHREQVVSNLIGYVVRKSVTIRLRDISKFEALFADLLDAGVNTVHGVEFRTSELRKHRDQARLLAIKAAREKAQALAEAAGKKLGETLTINEGGGGWYSPYGSWWGRGYGFAAQNVVQNSGGSGGTTEGNLAPGQITVTANVSLTIALE